MKRTLMLACAGFAALLMTEGTASAQCGYGGGYGYYGGYRSSGISIGYSRYTPRTTFSIGYNSYPSINPYYGRGFGYAPPTRFRSSYSYRHVPGRVYRGRVRHW